MTFHLVDILALSFSHSSHIGPPIIPFGIFQAFIITMLHVEVKLGIIINFVIVKINFVIVIITFVVLVTNLVIFLILLICKLDI